jgi:hypothetical protein
MEATFIINPDGTVEGNPAGIRVTKRDDGGFDFLIDPIVAHNLAGSKAKLSALRAQMAEARAPWEREREAMTDVLMKVTIALSSLVESYDWVMQSPQSGLTDEGRARIRMFFLTAVQSARTCLADARTATVDWDEVVGGRKVEAPPVENGAGRPVWATMAAELQAFVNGPEGAALVRMVDRMGEEDPGLIFAAPVDWLHWLYESSLRGMAACRALMETDPARKDFATKLYQGLAAVSLNVSRQLVVRQLTLVPEPEPTRMDPYIQCHDCVARERCEAERRCARAGAAS